MSYDDCAPSMSIAEFCRLEKIHRSTFHNWVRAGLAPHTYRVGRVIRISYGAYASWRHHVGAALSANTFAAA